MNANELAEQLDEYAGNSGYSHNDYADSMSQAATMLRQQHTSLISDVEVIERLAKEIQVKDEAIFNSQKQAYNLAMQVQNQKALIKQLEETQVYLYKTHDADKAGIEALYYENSMLKNRHRLQQAEIERLTTKNLEWLANWNEQQAEIEALKSQLNPYQSITDTKIEPTIVSYTHPVELSDEEIYEIGKQYLTQYEDGLYDFARAILKKASEK